GTVVMYVDSKENLIRNVHFAPDVVHNLISVGQLIRKGYAVVFEDEACVVKTKNGDTVLTANMKDNNMFPVDLSSKN
ncbi:hypothetical protein Tco_0399507, partial [Tanacetum coccineum]